MGSLQKKIRRPRLDDLAALYIGLGASLKGGTATGELFT